MPSDQQRDPRDQRGDREVVLIRPWMVQQPRAPRPPERPLPKHDNYGHAGTLVHPNYLRKEASEKRSSNATSRRRPPSG
jgi:hypothetical protein